MPTYSTPGVYVTEKALASTVTPSASGTQAVFFGAAERGPTTATLITDWASYKRVYGDLQDQYDLGYAVYHYFANGGQAAHVVRIPGTYDAGLTTAASVTPVASSVDVEYFPQGGSNASVMFTATAVSTGSWGDNLTVTLSTGLEDPSATSTGTFTAVVALSGTEVERWTEVSLDPNAGRYVGTLINTYSNYIRVSAVSTVAVDAGLLLDTTAFALTGGAEGAVGPQDYVDALGKIDTISGNLLLNAVGQTNGTVVGSLVTKASNRGDSFVIIDPDKTSESLSQLQTVATTFSGLSSQGYAAHYSPALVMVDPAKTGPGAIRTTYPGGAIAGLIARTDVQRTVAKAPAGYGAEVRGALGLSVVLSDTDIGTLYDGTPHVNSFKSVTGAGVVVYGARTLARTTADKFIPVRRTLNYLKHNLQSITEFAVFEPNDPRLWMQVTARVASFLSNFYRDGGLRGANTSQAFYVICNSTNNTSTSIAEGVVNVEVGVALQYPAEFIVINLSQWTGGSNTVDSL